MKVVWVATEDVSAARAAVMEVFSLFEGAHQSCVDGPVRGHFLATELALAVAFSVASGLPDPAPIRVNSSLADDPNQLLVHFDNLHSNYSTYRATFTGIGA
jgi:hypothetical protein